MILATQRLVMNIISRSDLEAVHALHCLPETDEYNTLGLPADIAVTQTVLDGWLAAQQQEPRASYVFAVSIVDTGQFIGLIGLKLGEAKYRFGEVWYKIHVDHWRNGYATEMLQRLLVFAFNELGLHRVEAGCAVDNLASAAVLEKAGMTREGRKRKKLPIRGAWHDNYLYAILEEDLSGS